MPCPDCAFTLTEPAPFCPRCGTALAPLPPGYASPYGYGNPYGDFGPAPSPVSQLGNATMLFLGVVAVCQVIEGLFRLAGVTTAALGLLTAVPVLVVIVLFLVWFSRIRANAGLWAPQRRSQGWSIGAWFTPVVFLWFPLQIVIDAFRASKPGPPSWSPVPRLVPAWWTCWILAWVTAFHTTGTTTIIGPQGTPVQSQQFSLFLGSTIASNVFSAAAAVLALLVVQRLTQLQTARIGR